jgi:hypothetical protein
MEMAEIIRAVWMPMDGAALQRGWHSAVSVVRCPIQDTRDVGFLTAFARPTVLGDALMRII